MKRIILISLFLQIGLFNSLFAQPYSVSGKVYSSPDGFTQIAIANARVYSEVPYVAETYTDANGDYTFTDVPAGTLMTIHAEKSGYIFSPSTIERLVNQNYSNCDFAGTSVAVNSIPVTFYYDAGNTNPASVYLAGSMNGYNPSDDQYKLTDNGNGIFSITKDFEPGEIIYKYVVDGNWLTDPYNPVSDGSQYNNSKLIVADPMITYLLPAFNESYSGSGVPSIKAIVASSENSISPSDLSLKINSNPVAGTPTFSNENRVCNYTPLVSELLSGSNSCEVSFTASGITVTRSIQFQYTPETGNTEFSVSGYVLDAMKLPVAGVTVSNGSAQVSTDFNGFYSLSACTASMTITPSKTGCSFTPVNISLGSYSSDVSDANFIANEGGGSGETEFIQYTISGTVMICSSPVEGAEVESRGKTVYTAADGSYSITDNVETNGSFYEPASVLVNISAVNFAGETSQQIYLNSSTAYPDINFSGKYATDTITGTVSYPSGLPYAGKPLKWEMLQGEHQNEVLYDSVIHTDISGSFKAPHYYTPSNMPDQYFMFSIKPEQSNYSYNPIRISSYQSCQDIKNKNMEVAMEAVPLCMVTVSEDSYNTVVWNMPETDEIEGFAIYKETNVANEYLPLDTVEYGNSSVYVDTESDPSVKAYRYKLSTILKQDYSVLNEVNHKTIHLTINKGTGNSWNLIWSHYEGVSITTYKLYRGTDENSMEYLSEIAGNLNSYTDNTAPEGDVYYQIELILEDACNPEIAPSGRKSFELASDFTSTRSNIVNSAAASDPDRNTVAGDMLYPNPAENVLNLRTGQNNFRYEIYSIQGFMVSQGTAKEQIDVSNLLSGMYQVRIITENQWATYKFIKK